MGLMSMDVLKVLEKYGEWKAEVLNIYGLDSEETNKLSTEIADRLKNTCFRRPTTLEIRDNRRIEENIHLIDSANKIYCDRNKMEIHDSKALNGESNKEHFFHKIG